MRRPHLLALLSVLLGLPCSGQGPAPSSPLEAELIRSLDAAKLNLGDTVLFTVAEDWHAGACTLPQGATLHAKVVALEPYTAASHHTSLALRFSTACDEALREPLTWISLLAPVVNVDPSTVSIQAFHSSTFGEGGNGQSTGIGHTDTPDMTGHQNPNFPVFLQPAPDPKQRRPTQVLPGQVWHLADLSLKVAAGPDGSTILASSKRSLRLPAHALLVLRSARPMEIHAIAVPIQTPPRSPAPPPLPEQVNCVAPRCTILSSLPLTSPQPLLTIPLAAHGFYRLRSAEMRNLTSTAALAFLGNDQLLITFDSHRLTPRHPADRPESSPRMVRALLVQLSTGHLLKTEDWRVPDNGRYLWAESGRPAILHQRDRLIWLGPDLQEASSLPLSGPLASLQLSPDRLHLAVGILHELHTPEEHAELLANSGTSGPEEQVQLHLYSRTSPDASLHLVSISHQSSRALPPTLTNTGQLTLLRGEPGVWHLRLTTWSGASQLFARFHSTCFPHLEGVAANQLMLTGCDSHTDDRWFRILRPDGTLLARGTLHSQQLSPLAIEGAPTDSVFPLAVPLAAAGWAPTSPFHASEITGEQLLLLRTENGAPLLSIRIHEPALTRQPFALDPTHHRLAVFEGESVFILSLPPMAGANPQFASTGSAAPAAHPPDLAR